MLKSIKQHIKKRGDEFDVEVTPSMVLYWWARLNKTIFNGQLIPPQKIICRNFRDGDYGWCSPYKHSSQVRMGIRRTMPDRKTFLTVLVHEMVHQWEHQQHKRMSHGYNFYRWKDLIKRELNLPLQQYIDTD